MHLVQVLSNRVKLDFDDDKGGEYVEISLLNDDGETQLCRVNQENIVDAKNFFDLALQFAANAAQKKAQNQKVVGVQGQLAKQTS